MLCSRCVISLGGLDGYDLRLIVCYMSGRYPGLNNGSNNPSVGRLPYILAFGAWFRSDRHTGKKLTEINESLT